MGLCKCPKKKVTNLFCFEHRVNVCEHCLVANHSKCVVQSYLKWLQDSDYNPCCLLCNQRLDNEAYGDCVRLLCYDVFHWRCLNMSAQQLPANTAPAGYTCPQCRQGLFPASNVVSPVADALRSMLSQVNWARAGLGLPLIEEKTVPKDQAPPAFQNISATSSATSVNSSVSMVTSVNNGLHQNNRHEHTHVSSTYNHTEPTPYTQHNMVSSAVQHHTAVHIDDGMYSRAGDKTAMLTSGSRIPKIFDGNDSFVANMSTDHDEDKYKRRSAFQWLTKWFRSRAPTHRRKDPNATFKRFAMVLVIGVVGFITVIIIFSKLGHMATDDDPALNPMANPNIRIEE